MTLLQLASGITKKRAWRQLWPKTKSEIQKGSINNGYNKNNSRHRRWWAKSGHFDFRKIYREPLFLCVAVLVLFHLLSHTHTHTTLLVDCLHLSWPIGAASATAAVGPLANTFIYELEKHWLNKSNSPGQKNSASLTVFYAFLCSKRYSATSTKIQDTSIVMAAIYECIWKDNHYNAYWNSCLASSSCPFCI